MRRLLIRPGAIGDCVLSFPALTHLRTGYTEVWVPSALEPLITFADRVRALSSTSLDLLGLPELPPQSKLLDHLSTFDDITSWYGSNRPEFRNAVSALPFQFYPALPAPDCQTHCADFFAAQVGAPTPSIPCIPLTPSQKRATVVIHPFSGSPRKNWPLHRYRELAHLLPLPVEWTAGPEEPLPTAHRSANLYNLAVWIAGAQAYIGNDSGITHLAAAVGTPVVALFGPTDPAVWAPRGPNVRIVHAPLEQISVAKVLDAFHSLF